MAQRIAKRGAVPQATERLASYGERIVTGLVAAYETVACSIEFAPFDTRHVQ